MEIQNVTMSATVAATYDDTVARVRDLLAEAGFGVLTEIDVRNTLKAKLDVDVPARLILGACRPQLAHQALEIEPRVAALMPCNVVVADAGEGRTSIDVLDPGMLAAMSPDPALAEVARDGRARLEGMMMSLTTSSTGADDAARA